MTLPKCAAALLRSQAAKNDRGSNALPLTLGGDRELLTAVL